jgi:predicted permease
LLKDFVYAARALRKSPVFAVTAVATIALGVGASTAIFSVANAVLLRKLPYKDPERLVIGLSDLRNRNVRDQQFSNADFIDLKNGTKAQFEEMTTAFTFRNIVPRGDGTPEQVHFALVSPNFFRVMGATVSFGRDFTDADGEPQRPPDPAAAPNTQPPPVPPVAILSYSYWQRRFGGSTEIFNKGLLPNGNGPRVVGVLAPGFELLFPPRFSEERVPDLYLAARIGYDAAQRNGFSHRIIGRLKPGVSLEQAQAAADLITAETRKNFLISGTAGYYARFEPFHKYLVADVQPAILALLGAVIFLLLIACANVGNLLLVRASLRERELAVRAALGGSWMRLVRQMFSEALLLAALGTAAGLALAAFGIQQLRAIAPANLPRLDQIKIDPEVLGFTALAGLAAAAIFGLVPALRASRPDVMNMLRGSGRTAGLGRGRMLRNGVVVAEVGLSFVLLIGSGLMLRSFLALQAIADLPVARQPRRFGSESTGGISSGSGGSLARDPRSRGCHCGKSVSAYGRIQHHPLGTRSRALRPR